MLDQNYLDGPNLFWTHRRTKYATGVRYVPIHFKKKILKETEKARAVREMKERLISSACCVLTIFFSQFVCLFFTGNGKGSRCP